MLYFKSLRPLSVISFYTCLRGTGVCKGLCVVSCVNGNMSFQEKGGVAASEGWTGSMNMANFLLLP